MKESTASQFLRLTLSAIIMAVICAMASASRPDQKPRKAPKQGRITLRHADNLRFDQSVMNGAQRLSGNVVLEHAGMVMHCDSALLYELSQTFDAFGHVRLNQGDTLSLTGNRLHYDGETQIAEMRENVTLTHRAQRLTTDSLNYDRLYHTGYYFDGGELFDGPNSLSSDWGEYHTDTRRASFNFNVQLTSPRFRLLTDTLHYDTQTKWAEVLGKSNIISASDRIYTEHGFYNTDTENVRLLDRSQAFSGSRTMEGDTLLYDKRTGTMEAIGHACCLDTTNRNLLTADYARYNELSGEAFATGRALARDFSQGDGKDTLYVHADTLRMFTLNLGTDSVYRSLHAYFHARAYRSDLQAVADSLVFSTRTRRLTLYRDPILWSENRQIVGEEINAFLNDSTLDSVYVDRQALMAEQVDSTHFNQVASNQMRTYFSQGEVRENQALGNVMVVNFPLEKDSLILYQNYVETSRARMFMAERKLQRIWTPASHCYFYPLGLAPEERTRLAGFEWFDYIRPVSPDDVFQWRPKRAGSELKPSLRRQAPLQKL